MADKKSDDKQKYTEVPKDEIPTAVRKSHFSANEDRTTTLFGVATPQQRDKKND
jgi:hypothetical protein